MKAQSRCYIAFRGILVIKVWSLTGILAGRGFVYTVNSTEIKLLLMHIMYFFGYKTEFFFLPKQSQRSRSLGLFRKGKIGIVAKFHRTDLVI